MKKQFIGGIFYREPGEVLLVLRAKADDQMAGLWTLPGGEIEAGEHPKTALVREFMEETGLVVTAGEQIATIERRGCIIHVHSVTSNNSHIQITSDKDIETLRFFRLNELPEQIVAESRISIAAYVIKSTKIGPVEFTYHVEGLFSSLFYSYIKKGLNDFGHIDGWNHVEYVILNTPFRKFKSCLPYLLAECDPSVCFYAILAEVLFAIWTIMDDVCDGRSARYERPSVLQQYGIAQVVPTLFLLQNSLRELFSYRQLNHEFTKQLMASIVECGKAQLEWFLPHGLRGSTEYLERASRRTQFLRTAWLVGLNTAGKSAEASLLYSVHTKTAITGQIINDFFDLCGNLDDFHNRRDSYYLLVLAEAVGIETLDYNLLASLLSVRSGNAVLQLRSLCQKYGIGSKLELEIAQRSLSSISQIEMASGLIGEEKKDILVGWIAMGFKHLNNNILVRDFAYKERLIKFVSAFDALCGNIN